MRRTILSVAALLVAGSVLAAPAQHKSKKPHAAVSVAGAARPAVPKTAYQYITVDEFVRGTRPANTAVSIEGYVVFATRTPDGGLRLAVVDDVSRVLNPEDAEKTAKPGATALLSGASVRQRAAWAWSPRGMA